MSCSDHAANRNDISSRNNVNSANHNPTNDYDHSSRFDVQLSG